MINIVIYLQRITLHNSMFVINSAKIVKCYQKEQKETTKPWEMCESLFVSYNQ